ncbi:acyl-CoA dehydrogenase/oxidase C-terminal [Phascolomyces articulosus]|uniref:Acyl-coenzyme A oxidase n=1 Tax=Phascolomyces articulosus TaxID=60185 RepID=A0AAD5PED2_9FUNG|nr:acyl-CoA dehydrogenase/oxidase C-terminal [Phascolomyces articulosus]
MVTSFNNNVPTKFPKLQPKAPNGPDLLQIERSKASFDVDALSKFTYGEEFLKRKDKILKILEAEPAFEKTQRFFQGRHERLMHAYEKDKRTIELSEELGWTDEDRYIVNLLYDQPSPYSLHYTMFLPTLKNQCNDEQIKLFYERALRHEIIGCYAQTELGHGSNIQGLETTATYIPETNEFEIHSPHLTSSKWWIGTLGKTANYAVVMARLMIHGKDYGPHPFCVQIRSLEDHRPLPGITVGDIGPKFGYNTIDNGFMMFNHYRVPHIAFLAKFTQVKPGTGEYVKPVNARLSYGTMVLTRAGIVNGSGLVLARGATVAIRYSAIRRQFVDLDEPRKWRNEIIETPVIDYTQQQYRLLSIVANAYAVIYASQELRDQYEVNQEQMQKGNFSFLADLHASSSGLKSLTTTMALEGLEDCRRACGGHGFSLFSGLGFAYQDYLPFVTFEGDNYVLTQQTTRYLLKTFRSLIAGKTNTEQKNLTTTYLSQYLQNPNTTCPAISGAEFLNPELILTAFGYRAAYGVAQLVEELDQNGRSWNSVLVDVARVCKAHCQLVLVQSFFVRIQQASEKDLGPEERKVLQSLAYLFALHTMEKDVAEFLVSGYLSAAQSKLLKRQVLDLVALIRPNAVSLVDAFSFPDYFLASALGRYDGNVYEAMTEYVEKEPLNQKVVVDGYEKYIKPFVHRGLQRKNDSKL